VAMSTIAGMNKNAVGLDHSIEMLCKFGEDEIRIINIEMVNSTEYFILLFDASDQN
jgi:hypothetical protein